MAIAKKGVRHNIEPANKPASPDGAGHPIRARQSATEARRRMKRIPAAVIDALGKLSELPEYIRDSVDYRDRARREIMPDADFADHNRRYPAFDKSSTFISAIEYYVGDDHDLAAWDGLWKAAHALGIDADIEKTVSRLRGCKKATGTAEYALVYPEGNRTERLFPCAESGDLMTSAFALRAERAALPYCLRRLAARNLLNRAAKLGMSIPNYVSQAAGVGPVSIKQAETGLRKRAVLAAGAAKIRYRELCASAGRAGLFKTAELTDLADRWHGFHAKYSAGLASPEELFFDGGSELATAIRLMDRTVPLAAVRESGLSMDDLGGLDETFVANVRTPPAEEGAGESGVNWENFATATTGLGEQDLRRLGRLLRRKGV